MGSPRISVLGLWWPDRIGALATTIEQFGYHRYWATEHHTTYQSSSPLISAAVAAALTTRLRVATAGVMLRYLTPLRVAKDVHLLNSLFPGRVDVGVIRGPADGPSGGPAEVRGAQGGDLERGDWYPTALSELRDYLIPTDEVMQDGPSAGIYRSSSAQPRLWVCSNSHSSAFLAATLGAGFCCHLPQAGAGAVERLKTVVATYRSAFQGNAGTQPSVAVVCAGACAETEVAARKHWADYVKLWLSQRKQTDRLPSDAIDEDSYFFGRPEACYDRIHAIARELAADEVILWSGAGTFEEAMRSYEFLAPWQG
jgi:luciferase family oxidoreductase group 1